MLRDRAESDMHTMRQQTSRRNHAKFNPCLRCLYHTLVRGFSCSLNPRKNNLNTTWKVHSFWKRGELALQIENSRLEIDKLCCLSPPPFFDSEVTLTVNPQRMLDSGMTEDLWIGKGRRSGWCSRPMGVQAKGTSDKASTNKICRRAPRQWRTDVSTQSWHVRESWTSKRHKSRHKSTCDTLMFWNSTSSPRILDSLLCFSMNVREGKRIFKCSVRI